MCDLLELVKPDSRLQGTIRLFFAAGNYNLCKPSEAPTVFEDLASTSGFSIPQEPEIEPRYKYACGRREVVDMVVRENGFSINAILHDLTLENLKKLYRGSDAEAFSQADLASQAIDGFDFSTTPSSSESLYFLTDSSSGSKTSVMNVTSLIISNSGVPLVEGEDYVYMKTFGAVKFLTTQNTVLTVEVSASATDTTPLDLGGNAPIKGWLRALYYPTVDTVGDQCEPEMMIDQVGFLSFEDTLEISDESTSEPTMVFTVSGTSRVTDLRSLA
jgi:hypothetical protein